MDTAMQELMKSKELKLTIGYRAHALWRRFPRTLEQEDIEQELWIAVIRAMNKQRNISDPVKVARDAVYSQYGTFLHAYSILKLEFYESISSIGSTVMSESDTVELSVENQDLLDSLCRMLKQKSRDSQQFKHAYHWVRLSRDGLTTRECTAAIGISKAMMYRIINNFVIPTARTLL